MVFLLKNADIMKGEIYIDLKPFVEEVLDQMVNFFDFPAERLVWSDIVYSNYFGSEGTEAELGWILYDARLVPPELTPKIVVETVTETQEVTETETTTVTETTTLTQTTTETTTEETTTTITTTVAPDAATLAIIGIIALIIGFVVGMVLKGKR